MNLPDPNGVPIIGAPKYGLKFTYGPTDRTRIIANVDEGGKSQLLNTATSPGFIVVPGNEGQAVYIPTSAITQIDVWKAGERPDGI